MPCFHPLQAYYGDRKDNGKHEIVFNLPKSVDEVGFQLPCGRCDGCRLERSRQWALRCVHEASLHDSNCFITLTYDNEHLPADGSLVLSDFQNFLKRLRKRFVPKCPYPKGHCLRKQWFEDNGIRFFHCGEYGEKYGRPHYHVCIFGHDFDDKVLFKNERGVKLYTSSSLSDLWKFGFSSVGDVTFESAAYVARYIMKKQFGDSLSAVLTYANGLDLDTGEILTKCREYTTMSRRPGIGRNWYEKNKSDVYPRDYVVIRDGVKVRPPKYYDSIFELTNPELFEDIKFDRYVNGKRFAGDNTPERLAVREKVLQSKLQMLKRQLE